MLKHHDEILALNGLRGMAALLVIMCHLPIPIITQQKYPFLTSLFAFGWVGVPIYFLLSGYLITWLALKEKKQFHDLSLKLFFVRRILRLWPIYIIICGFCLWCYQFPELDAISASPDWVLPLVTFTTNFAITMHQEHFGAVGVFWTLALEEQFYVISGILLKKCKPNLLFFIFSLMICCCSLWRFYPLSFSCFLHYRIQFPVSLLTILLGCIVALYQERYGLTQDQRILKILAFMVIIISLGMLFCEYPFPLNPSSCAILMFAADGLALGLVLLCLSNFYFIQFLMCAKVLRYLGKLSLCIYAINILVIFFYDYIKQHYFFTSILLQQHPQWRFLWDTVMIILINILLAKAWLYIEEPIAKLRYSFRPGKRINSDAYDKIRWFFMSRFF